MKTFALLLALVAIGYADEVVLKDGRKIEFKSLEDTGETYTVVTPEGARVVVKRADVDSLSKTEPAVALTGATMSFGKNSKLDSIDLLKKIETDKDFLAGSWKFEGPALQGEAMKVGENSCCQIRYTPASDEYNLTIVIERQDGDDNIGIAFPVPGGKQCQFFFDIDRSKYSAILTPGGPEGHQKASTPVQGKQLSAKKPRTVVFMVRKGGLVVQVDGKDVSTFRSDWTKIAPLCGPQVKDAFAVSALQSGIKILKMSVTVQK